jgi:hypothetical protein
LDVLGLQEKVRNLEREVEWVRGEREEEMSAMAHEKKETASRLRELEAASNRLKSARKDDLKRVSKEKSQASDRCKVSPYFCQTALPASNIPGWPWGKRRHRHKLGRSDEGWGKSEVNFCNISSMCRFTI